VNNLTLTNTPTMPEEEELYIIFLFLRPCGPCSLLLAPCPWKELISRKKG